MAKKKTTRKKKTAVKVIKSGRKKKVVAAKRLVRRVARALKPSKPARKIKAARVVKASAPRRRTRRRARRKAVSQSSASRGKSLVRIKVVGIGGGGGNAVTRMRRDFHARGVEFLVINTDLQDLEACDAHRKLHIGRALTKGMGAGMNPELGQQSAEENRSEIAEALQGADMVFLTAGFGG